MDDIDAAFQGLGGAAAAEAGAMEDDVDAAFAWVAVAAEHGGMAPHHGGMAPHHGGLSPDGAGLSDGDFDLAPAAGPPPRPARTAGPSSQLGILSDLVNRLAINCVGDRVLEHPAQRIAGVHAGTCTIQRVLRDAFTPLRDLPPRSRKIARALRSLALQTFFDGQGAAVAKESNQQQWLYRIPCTQYAAAHSVSKASMGQFTALDIQVFHVS